MHEKQTYTENYIETMFEIGKSVEYIRPFGFLQGWPWRDNKDLYWDARSWAHEFEKQYDDNEDYYDAIHKFVMKKVKDKYKEYYPENR